MKQIISTLVMAFSLCVWGGETGQPTVLLDEGFEADGALQLWNGGPQLTESDAGIVSPGQVSSHALLIEKFDNCGLYALARETAAPGGRWLRLSADVKVERMLLNARYTFMVTKLSKGVPKAPNLFLEFDDGIQKSNPFGGTNKTPQTMGEWKRTESLFLTDPDVDRVKITLLVLRGAQSIRFDNIRLEDVGTEKPARNSRRVFAKLVDWPYAELDLDDLVPGCTYEIAAEVARPDPSTVIKGLTPGAALSSERAPLGSVGMGVSMFTTDLFGKDSLRQSLPEMPDLDGRKIYRLTVPADAVTVHLDFHNDDLIRFDHNQIEAQARRWKTVEINLLDFGEIAADNQMCQWIYRGFPDSLKPRDVVELSEFDLQALKARLAQRKPAPAKVAKINNGLCLLVEGKPVPPMLTCTMDFTAWPMNLFGEPGKNGLNIVDAHYPYGGPPRHGDWTGPGQYDFHEVDEYIYRALKQNPDAYIIFSVDDVTPPAWWGEQYPDEIVRDKDGRLLWTNGYFLYERHFGDMEEFRRTREATEKQGNFFGRLRGARWPGSYFPSPASEKARATMAGFLTDLRRHIESRPYGNAVIGYRLLWGYDGQWGTGVLDLDLSRPMLARFNRYVREKYGTETALRQAWNDPAITFDRVQMPKIEHNNLDTTVPGVSYFLDPEQDQSLIDYRECMSLTVGEQLIQWAQAVKSAGQREVICLAYYPDISECCTGGPGSQRGHRQVLAAPGLDMAGGPSYQGREIGLDDMSNVMLNSFTLHGKIPMTEMDLRLFPTVKRNYSSNLIFDTPRKSISALRREYMKQMCFSGGSWTMDMGGGWFSDPLIAGVVGQARRVFAGVIGKDRASIARMALFVGETGKNIQADGIRGAIPQALGMFSKNLMPHCGVPVDEYAIWDLPLAAKQYKVFLFPFAYALTDEERQWIESLKRNGNLLVFGYGAGYVGHDLSLANMESVTGMKFARDDRIASLTLKVTDREHPITREMRGYLGGDTGNATSLPRIYVNDPQTVTLGEFVGSEHRAALAFKDFGDWQSIYVGAVCPFPPELLRGCARLKNLPIYNTGNDVMYFCRSMVAIHASSDGVKTIELPEKAEVTSLWDGIYLGAVERIVRPMRVGDNALYLISPSARNNKHKQ